MKIKQVYVADDGYEFNSEEACLSHELTTKKYIALDSLWETCEDSTVDFIMNNYGKIKAIMDDPKQYDIDWTAVPEGRMILVRDNEDQNWLEREFVRYIKNDDYNIPFMCRHVNDVSLTVNWKFGKLIPI